MKLLKIASLCHDPKNANRGTKRGDAMIERSLRQYGAGRSILLDKHGTIIAGNKTIKNAKAAGMQEVIIVPSDGRQLVAVQRTDLDLEADPRARELAIADNRTSEINLEWDAVALEELAKECDLSGFFADDELAGLLDSGLRTNKVAEPQIDRAAELQQQWKTVAGQLWECSQHRIAIGDCRDADLCARLLAGVVPATVVFDPPYDAEKQIIMLRWPCANALVFTDHRHLFDAVSGWPPFRSAFVWDGVTSWFTPGWPLARAKFCLWFGTAKYKQDGSHYGEPGNAHVVTNTRGSYAYKPDARGKHLSTVFQSPNTKQFAGHAHAKPADWVRMLLANCTEGDVFDPFCGSGTSIIACEQIGRICRAVEIDPAIAAVALQRCADSGLTARLAETQPNLA